MPSNPLGKTVYELYLERGARFGFEVVSWRPRYVYGLVRDFGYFATSQNEKRWVAIDPNYVDTTSDKHRYGFLVDLYNLNTGALKVRDQIIRDSIGWQHFPPNAL